MCARHGVAACTNLLFVPPGGSIAIVGIRMPLSLLQTSPEWLMRPLIGTILEVCLPNP